MRFNQNTAVYQLIAPQNITGGTTANYHSSSAGFFSVPAVKADYGGNNQFFNTARIIFTSGACGTAAAPIEQVTVYASSSADPGASPTALLTFGATTSSSTYAMGAADLNQVLVADINLENKGEYLSLQVITGTGASGANVQALVVFGDASQAPVNQAQSGATTPTGGAAAQLYAISL